MLGQTPHVRPSARRDKGGPGGLGVHDVLSPFPNAPRTHCSNVSKVTLDRVSSRVLCLLMVVISCR